MFPLNDAPYTAAYEEQEVFAAFHNLLLYAEDEDILPSISMLIPEFLRYIVNRAAFYYPPNLPKEMLSEEVKTGQVDHKLWIAIEDIHDLLGKVRRGQARKCTALVSHLVSYPAIFTGCLVKIL